VSVADLAERMGLPVASVQDDIERGRIGVRANALAEAFGTSVAMWCDLDCAYESWRVWKGIER